MHCTDKVQARPVQKRLHTSAWSRGASRPLKATQIWAFSAETGARICSGVLGGGFVGGGLHDHLAMAKAEARGGVGVACGLGQGFIWARAMTPPLLGIVHWFTGRLPRSIHAWLAHTRAQAVPRPHCA